MSRLLVIMGSGETSPTMVKTHRALFDRLAVDGGPGPSFSENSASSWHSSRKREAGSVPAALLDTPFGFQENADDIAARAVEYFRESVGVAIEVASFRTPGLAADDPVAYESMLARLRAARYVFAGPGSPSYALRVWEGSGVPGVLADKLQSGGCVVFASAAALTLGVVTVPVYEVYKVGADPVWLPGLDLLGSALGVAAAVIPHYNNAEGGNHDTRYCYLGERRLRMLEESLPSGAFVLGVDEHTGLVLDLDAGSASVVGLGVVTVRKDGQSTVFEAGTTIGLSDLRPGSAGPSGAASAPAPAGGGPAATRSRPEHDQSPLLETVAELEASFAKALAAADGPGAVRAVLELEDALVAWSRDTLQSDEMDRARSVMRSMIVRLGETAVAGLRDPAGVVAPFVDALLSLRTQARADRRWADADAVRDALVEVGVEVNDGPEGTTWRLLG
jgi:hypothetical protein